MIKIVTKSGIELSIEEAKEVYRDIEKLYNINDSMDDIKDFYIDTAEVDSPLSKTNANKINVFINDDAPFKRMLDI